MPRKSGFIDETLEFGTTVPKASLIIAAILGAIALCLYLFLPSTYRTFSFLAFLAACAFAIAGGKGFFTRHVRAKRFEAQRTLEDLRALSWKQFEELVADVYRRQGFRVTEVGGSGDRGIDLVLTSPTGQKQLVQCKQWRTWRVGAPSVREFVGAMADVQGANSGLYVAVGTFTPEAIALANRHRIELVNGEKLLELVRSVKGPIVVASDPAHAVPQKCPKCGASMVLRSAKRGAHAGSSFWGCATYPQCRGTRPFAE